MHKTTIVSLIAVVIALSVALNSAHAKDLAVAAKQDDQAAVKVTSELHNHIDKTGKSLLKVASDTQADARSLRLREHKKRVHPIARWLNRHNHLFA